MAAVASDCARADGPHAVAYVRGADRERGFERGAPADGAEARAAPAARRAAREYDAAA